MATKAPRVLSEFFETSHGESVAIITSPLPADYIGLPPAGTVLKGGDGQPLEGAGLSLTVTPDGEFQARPAGSAGAWESCTRANGFAVYSPTPSAVYKIPCA